MLGLFFRLSCFVIRRQSEIASVHVGMECHEIRSEHGPWFRREGNRKRIPVSMGFETLEWIDPASPQSQIFRATGEPLHGGLRPQIAREDRVS